MKGADLISAVDEQLVHTCGIRAEANNKSAVYDQSLLKTSVSKLRVY